MDCHRSALVEGTKASKAQVRPGRTIRNHLLGNLYKSRTVVYLLEQFGSPEAIWELEVEKFPVVVTMDSHRNSLQNEVLSNSQSELAKRL